VPDDLDDAALESRLYPVPTTTAKDWRSLPDWPAIHRELRRKGVTLQLVWEEYRAAHPDGYGRSWFCELYRAWEGRLSPTMRQPHVAGEKLFVDYAGTTIDIVDAATGEVRACQLFVAALGASSLTYAEATFTQSLPDWIGSHTRAFVFYGGVPAMGVSGNLKSGITKAWEVSKGANVKVAVIDSGVDGKHPDLKGVLSAGADVSGAGGPGGQQSIGAKPEHGTLVATMLAGRGHQPAGSTASPSPGSAVGPDGIVGVAPEAQLLSVSTWLGSVNPGGKSDQDQIPEAVRWAEQMGVEKLCLSVYPDNEPAGALYTKFGFVEEGRMTGHSKKAIGYRDEIVMGRWLIPQPKTNGEP